jgi:hypothetical protein
VIREPGDHGAAGATDHGQLRASDADREQVIDTLKMAFVEGRLTRDQLTMRTGQALTSLTYGGLAAVTDAIPARPTGVQPLPASAPDRIPRLRTKKATAWAACAAVSPALAAAFFTYYGGFVVLFLLAFTGLTVASSERRRT